MSNPRKLLQAERVRSELEDYLSRWDVEIRLGSVTRHLELVGTICALLLEKLVRVTGETLQTSSYADRISLLADRSIQLWKRPPGVPSLRIVQ